MSEWEDVDAASPFDGVEAVDAIVYADQDLSPELRAQVAPAAPPPAYRPAPTRPQARQVGEWNPGGTIDPASYRPKPAGPNIIKAILIGLIPVALVVGVLYLVMNQYGMLRH